MNIIVYAFFAAIANTIITVMRIVYSETIYQCPHCDKTLKDENGLFNFLISVILFPVFILSIPFKISRYVFSEFILSAQIPKVGNPYVKCPKCGAKVDLGIYKSYSSLCGIEKFWYDRRAIFRLIYISGGLLIISLLLGFLLLSHSPFDRIFGTVSLCVSPVLFIAAFVMTVYWKKEQEKAFLKEMSAQNEYINKPEIN